MRGHRAQIERLPRYSPEELEEVRRAGEEELFQRDIRVIRHLLTLSAGEMDEIVQDAQCKTLRMPRRALNRYCLLKNLLHEFGGKLEVVATIGEKQFHMASL